ncbi:MAG: DUF58 domain-containing protein [Lentisphaeria bacterium]|nr:DUF58 domain-containing protein [Lentisphaeria bacterium]
MLPPELVRQIRLLEIRTDRAVDELVGGAYRSVFKGRGIEFDEVREYVPGDDVRTIDWNVSARTGSAFVKKFVEERELTVLLIVDVSASGDYGSAEKSRRTAAAELAALLAFSAGRNGDKAGLLIYSDRREHYVPPRSGRRHALRIVRDVLAHEPASRGTDLAGAMREAGRLLKKRGIVFILSDMLDDKPYEKELKMLNRRHDVIVLELSDAREKSWPGTLALTLEDAESGEVADFAGGSRAREKLNAELAAENAERRAVLRRARTDAVEIAGENVLRPLAEFFSRRARRRK